MGKGRAGQREEDNQEAWESGAQRQGCVKETQGFRAVTRLLGVTGGLGESQAKGRNGGLMG